MKDIAVLILEGEMDIINPKGVNAYSDTMKGSGIGAGIGLGGTALGWYIRRKRLNRELENCNGDPNCENAIKLKMKSLRFNTLGRGIRNTALGAGVGAGAGAVNQTAKGVLHHVNMDNGEFSRDPVNTANHVAWDRMNRIKAGDIQVDPTRPAGNRSSTSVIDDIKNSRYRTDINNASLLQHMYKTGQGQSWLDLLRKREEDMRY